MLHDAIYDQIKTIAPAHPGIAPENVAIPFIVFFQISNIPSPDSSGASRLDEIHYQVSVFDASYRAMETKAAAVRAALDEYSATAQGVTIERCSFQGENYINEGDGVHHKALDFKLTVKR